MSPTTPYFQPRILVIGVGGGGQNAVDRMLQQAWPGVDFAAANTDLQVLRRSRAPIQLQLGPRKTGGKGAGALPAVGEAAARESATEIYHLVREAHLVFLTAGLGGGTGTGALPVFAEIARKAGALVVAVVTLPFAVEGRQRRQHALRGLERLKPHVHTLISIENDRLLAHPEFAHLPLEAAFFAANDVLRQGVQAISDQVARPGLVNVDFADVARLLQRGGHTSMTIGKGRGANRLPDALQRAMHHPLTDSVPLHRARHLIVNLTTPDAVNMHAFASVMRYLSERTLPESDLAFGVVQDPTLPDGQAEIILLANVPDEPAVAPPSTHDTPAAAPPATPTQPPFPSPPLAAPASLEVPAFMRRRLR